MEKYQSSYQQDNQEPREPRWSRLFQHPAQDIGGTFLVKMPKNQDALFTFVSFR